MMNRVLEFLPIITFFVVFKSIRDETTGILYATGAAIVVACAHAVYNWLRSRPPNRQQLIMLALLVVFGGATLLLRDETYIKWKPSAASWVFGTAFLLSHFVGRKTLVEVLFDEHFRVPRDRWRRVNLAWCGFFVGLGCLNLYVAHTLSTAAWVNFKVFGSLGLMVVFTLLQTIYLMRYDEDPPDREPE